MYNDNCKTVSTVNEGYAVEPAPIEPMKEVILNLHDAMEKARAMSDDICWKLFGQKPIKDDANQKEVTCAYDALCDIRRITMDLMETLYAINQKIEG